MQQKTALIADPSEEITLALAAHLQPDFRAVCCSDGLQVLAALEEERPDILILELSLPRLDGIAILRELSRRDDRPRVLVLTSTTTDYVIAALQELPVDYLMRKPSPAHMVAERAREMLQPMPAEPMAWQVSDILIRLSIPEASRGYSHLLVGLPLLAAQSEQFLGKALYLEIARINNVSFESVEKAIRDAIRSGWERGDRDIWLRYFPGSTRCPQNKQFLTRIAGLLTRLRRCG